MKTGRCLVWTALVLTVLGMVSLPAAAQAMEPEEVTSLIDWFGTGLARKPGNRVSPGRTQVRPVLAHPLRDPSICKGPDGWYYLTGTDGTPILPEYGSVDFKNNDGIRVWRSRDLENWEFVTLALDLSLDALDTRGLDRRSDYRGWRRMPMAEPGKPDGEWVHGIQAPEIHYIKDNFWIVYSVNGVGGGLLKSTTGKAEGPYEDWALIGERRGGFNKGTSHLFFKGGSPSLFEDDDGAVYVLWSDGKIARLKEDLSGLAERPRLLVCDNPERTGELAQDFPVQVGRDGYFLKKLEGRYYLFATDFTSRGGESVQDVYVAWSENVYGPYSERRWGIPHADQTTVFEGPDGRLLATYCGNDPHAAFRNRAGMVPLGWTSSDHPHRIPPDTEFPRRLLRVNTERYLWHRLPPVSRFPLRDTQACRGPGGEIVYTGSHVTKDTDGKLYLWKSMDMVNWQRLEIWDWDRQKDLFDEPFRDPREADREQVFTYMDTEVWYLNDTFYVGYSIYGAQPNGHILKSTTGRAEGPYEPVYSGGISQPSFFQDEDGTVYMGTNGGYRRWKADLSGPVEGAPRHSIMPADGTTYLGDAAGQIARIAGRYVNFVCGWDGSAHYTEGHWSSPGAYTWAYSTAESLEGPWSREQVIGPHTGHGALVEDRFGNWWVCSFANEASQGQPCFNFMTAYIHPCRVSVEDGELIIRLADRFPDYVEKALRERN